MSLMPQLQPFPANNFHLPNREVWSVPDNPRVGPHHPFANAPEELVMRYQRDCRLPSHSQFSALADLHKAIGDRTVHLIPDVHVTYTVDAC
jgi:hypothetical protein